MIGKKIAHFEIISMLGEGGMGEVYRALDLELQRHVALKVLSNRISHRPDAMRRFRREARALAAVNHPNIGTIYGVEESDGARFLVLELVEGETLAHRLHQGSLGVAESLRVAVQISRALEAAHKKGLVHRDLKPGNVMIGPEALVKVLDFGLAKALDDDEVAGSETYEWNEEELTQTATLLTKAGARVGTLPYMSPEQVRGEDSDFRSDIWSFGCVLYEMLTGKMPHHYNSAVETVSAILQLEPDWDKLPTTLPVAVRAMLARCLTKEPNQRLHSISDARIELDESSKMIEEDAAAPRASSHPGFVSRGGSGVSSSTLGYLENLGGYTALERVGIGGMGEVYRARDRQMDRDVALKVIRPELVADEARRERFRNEAEMLSDLNHPNIAAIYQYGSESGIDFLAMEYVPGDSIAERLAHGAMESDEVSRLGSQVAAALTAAHRQGVVHRDLKPGNVLVNSSGEAKVIDFGLATRHRRDGDPASSAAQDLAAPMPFRAPELLDGGAPNPQTDIYSLGVLLYQMATARRPFEETNVEELRRSIREVEPQPPSERNDRVPPELDRTILRCLEKDPDRRFASADEVAEALRGAGAAEQRSDTGRFSSLPRWKPVVAAAALLLVLALVFVWMGRDERRDRTGTPGATAEPMRVTSMVVLADEINLSEEDRYLVDAALRTISNHLSAIESLATRVPPSLANLDRYSGDLPGAAAAYDVDTALLSSMASEGDRITLDLQLVDVATWSILWSEQVSGERSDFEDLNLRAAEAVRQRVRPTAQAFETPDRSIIDPQTRRLFERGTYYANLYINRLRPDDLARAQEALEAALVGDPNNAEAAATIALLHYTRRLGGVPLLEVAPEAEKWARRAIEIDPRSGRAWGVLSALESGGSLESSRLRLRYALKAAAFSPEDGAAHNRLSVTLMDNSYELATHAAHHATELDPLVLMPALFEAIYNMILGRTREALGLVSRVLEIEPDNAFGLYLQSLMLTMDGSEREGLEQAAGLERLVSEGRLHPDWVACAQDLARLGILSESSEDQQTELDAVVDRLVQMSVGDRPFPNWAVTTQGVAPHLVAHGRNETGGDLLAQRVEREVRDPYDFLVFHPDLQPLHGDPRFEAAAAAAGERFNLMLASLHQARDRGELPEYLEEPLADLLGRLRAAGRSV